MKRNSIMFLRFVGIEYLLVGLISFSIVGGFIISFLTPFIFVAPLQLISQAVRPGAGIILTFILSGFSAVGGYLGYRGANALESSDPKQRELGRTIWLILILVSIITTVWNFVGIFGGAFSPASFGWEGLNNLLFVTPSLLWAIFYIIEYLLAIKNEQMGSSGLLENK